MKKQNIFYVLLLSVLMGGAVEAKQKSYFSEVGTEKTFDEMLAGKRHVVVWFYDYKNMAKKDYNNLRVIYDKVANTERYQDKENLQFLAVNVSTKQGRTIFNRYNQLNDTTMVELPAILLFKNGKMVNNQLGGAMTKERIKSFIERYFTRVPKAKKIYTK